MVHLKDPRWKTAAADPFSLAAVRIENALSIFKALEEDARADIEKYKELEKEAYATGLRKVVEMGKIIHELYVKMLDAQEQRHAIEDAWRKWDIDGLLRMDIIDRNLAQAMHAAPVEE